MLHCGKCKRAIRTSEPTIGINVAPDAASGGTMVPVCVDCMAPDATLYINGWLTQQSLKRVVSTTPNGGAP